MKISEKHTEADIEVIRAAQNRRHWLGAVAIGLVTFAVAIALLL